MTSALSGRYEQDPTLIDKLAELTLSLVKVPSVTGDEGALADLIGRLALARGAVVTRLGNAIIARRSGTAFAGSALNIGLFGHIDTVLPADNQPLGAIGGKVFGCGASDMKAGLAVMIALLGTPGTADLTAVFYDGEEGPLSGNGLTPILDKLGDLDLALALEPTANVIQAGCMGGLHATLTIPGRRAHSARPWQGENAILRSIPWLERLSAFGRQPVTVEDLVFYEVLTPTLASTQNSPNVVPDRFCLNLNYRFAPGRSLAEAKARLLDWAAGGKGPELLPGATLEIIDEAPAGAVTLHQEQLRDWYQRNQLSIEPKQAWTDIAQLTSRNIPAVNFGPGDPAQAHQAGEWVEVSAIERCYLLLADLLGCETGQQ